LRCRRCPWPPNPQHLPALSGHGDDDTLGIGKTEPSKWTGSYNVNSYGASVAQAIKAAGGKLWSPDSRDLDAAQIKQAHDLGISVIVWTVNAPAQMARFIDLGVDGIITDYPDRLRKVLIDKGVPVAKPAGRVDGGRCGLAAASKPKPTVRALR